MHKRTLLFLSLILALQTKAIHDPKTIGARSLGMGNIGVVGSDFNSVFNNQAALAYFQNTAFGINYDQGFFADKNLSTKTAAFVASTKLGGIGLNFSHFGYAQYQEQRIGLAYGKALGKRLAIGVQLNYFRTAIGGDYGQAHALSFEIGFYSKLSDQLELGAHIFNPIGAQIGQVAPQNIPISFQLGLLYKVDTKLHLATEVEKILDQKTSYKFGLEYFIVEKFIFRIGVATQPTLFTFGFGLNMNKLQLDIGTGFHQTLGFTPQISLRYTLK